MDNKRLSRIGWALVVGGSMTMAGSIVAYQVNKHYKKRETVILQSRNVAWMTVKDMLVPEADDINTRLDLASRALLHESFNKIVNKNF